MHISLKIVSSSKYSDAPPCDRYLEEDINNLISAGYVLHGSPFWAKTGDETYPVFYQAMIKELKQEELCTSSKQ